MAEILTIERKCKVVSVAVASPADFAYTAGEQTDAQIAPIEILALMWLSVMRRYVEWERRGIAMHAIRYEDMAGEPKRIIGAVFRYIGLPDSAVVAATQAFGQDSQEGTFLSRDTVGRHEVTDIQERQWEQVRALRKRYPVRDEHESDPPHMTTSSTV